MTKRDYFREIQEMRRSDADDSVELGIRCLIILACGATLYGATGHAFTLVWAIAYQPMILAYVIYLRRARGPIGLGTFLCAFAANVFIAGWFASLCLYIIWLGTPEFYFIGGCGICGLALHSIVRHQRLTYIAISDMIIVVLLTVGAIGIYIRINNGLAGDLAILTAGISIAGYYLHSFLFVIRMRQRLAQTYQDEAQAQKMRTVGQLTAGIAHDFNNLLTVIRGNLELLPLVSDRSERRELLTDATQATDRAAGLVSQLLSYSRKSEIQPVAMKASDVVEPFSAMAPRILPANITLEITTEPADAQIWADAALLQTALLNIASNARDSMAKAGGTFSLRIAEDEGGDWTEITCSDTGPGAAPEELSRLIEPFYTTKAVGKGSGLGLSMVQGFVEQSGGTLVIENVSPHGLAVRMRLPARGEKDDTDHSRSPDRAA